MKRLVPIGMLVLALIAPATTVTAQSGSAYSGDDYDWAYLFAGQAQKLSIDVGPNAVLFKLGDITVQGTLAADARAAIDGNENLANGDGSISSDEVATFEALAAATINGLLPTRFDFQLLTIDGKTAYAGPDDNVIGISRLDVSGLEGPIDSTDPITTDIDVLLRFDSVDDSAGRHSVRFENVYGDFTGFDASNAPPAQVIVSAYKSWAIDEKSIVPSELRERLDDDKITLGNADMAFFDQAGEALAFDMTGDPDVKVNEKSKRSPAITPGLLLAGLGVALIGMRRRV